MATTQDQGKPQHCMVGGGDEPEVSRRAKELFKEWATPPPLHDHNDHHNQKDKVELNSVLSPCDYVVLEKILPFIEERDMSSKSIIEMACLVKTSEADLVRLVTKMSMQLQIVKKLAV